MVDMYVALIIAGRRTIDTTPERYRAAVLVELNALGLDGYGNPLPVEPPAEPPVEAPAE
ncbi:CD1375 family protein [uncultured Exiguobacterium sp.]|uniref:CD1375 family protein n=1 Tax=uncultured Exiguobacterium sp. TaxID=202669 RepID=UPI0025D8857C|nr:CD1375 family protein [uncultured Exiguobacterium sp.]